jgi:hypothetical protein
MKNLSYSTHLEIKEYGGIAAGWLNNTIKITNSLLKLKMISLST